MRSLAAAWLARLAHRRSLLFEQRAHRGVSTGVHRLAHKGRALGAMLTSALLLDGGDSPRANRSVARAEGYIGEKQESDSICGACKAAHFKERAL